MVLHVKKASEIEKAQLFRMVHDIWPHHENVHSHLEMRLASPQHQRADWMVGLVDNELACGLGVYRTELLVEGKNYPLGMIGAVYTSSKYRRNGYAAKLIKEVMSDYEKLGMDTFMLYSDIDPTYYEKLGFVLKKMTLSKVLPIDHGFDIEQINNNDYQLIRPNLDCMIDREAGYTAWLFRKTEAQIFRNDEHYAIVGKHEGEDYILESSTNSETFIQTLAARLNLDHIFYWGKLKQSKGEVFQQEIPMFSSRTIDPIKLAKNIKLFPIDHV